MNKESSDLLRLALQSMLMGGGAYGGMRLLHDIPQQIAPKPKAKNELELTLPSDRIPKTANVSDYVLPPLVAAGGAGVGFLGLSKLYEHVKKKHMENQMQNVEQDYMSALQQAHQKTAELATPLTDKFLKGMISKVGELAAKEGWSNVNIPTEGPIDTAGHGVWDAIRGAGNTQIGQAGQAAALLTALATGGGVYYIHDQMDKQKEKNKQTTAIPSDIRLNVR